MRKFSLFSTGGSQSRNNYSYSLFKRHVAISPISSSDGIEMYALQNDLSSAKYPRLKLYEPCPDYIRDSINAFLSTLKPNSYYILVDKAVRKVDQVVDGGHILSFLTDGVSKINKDSTISLRPGLIVPDKKLTYSLEYLGIDRKDTRTVRYVRFSTLEEELEKHFFNQAISDFVGARRFLLKLPIASIGLSSVEISQRTTHVKNVLLNKWFILYDGVVDGDFLKAMNCVTGFYSQHLIRGIVINPSPQMAAWSYMSYLFGFTLRDNLIKNTGLRNDKDGSERINDDHLVSVTEDELMSIQSKV